MNAAIVPANPSNSLENVGLVFQVGSYETQSRGNAKPATSDASIVSSNARNSSAEARHPNDNLSIGIDLLV